MFNTDNDDAYDPYSDLTSEDRDHKVSAYTVINYGDTGYDYIHFYRKSDAQKFYKRLVKIGLYMKQIKIWTVGQLKQF